MLSQLLNRTVTIAHRPDPADDADVDVYGNADATATETTVETVGELQQRQRNEPGDQGELSDTHWLLILPAGTALGTADTVTVGDDDYEVVGDPWPVHNPRTGEEHHLEATLRRTA